jgi:hypothetical protein
MFLGGDGKGRPVLSVRSDPRLLKRRAATAYLRRTGYFIEVIACVWFRLPGHAHFRPAFEMRGGKGRGQVFVSAREFGVKIKRKNVKKPSTALNQLRRHSVAAFAAFVTPTSRSVRGVHPT